MERIDKKYAIIYVDREGECMDVGDDSDFCTDEMINDYYDQAGAVQWNFYLICAKEKVRDVKEFEENENYARKYAIPLNEIDSFIEEYFPDLGEHTGTIRLRTGRNWTDAVQAAAIEAQSLPGEFIPSFNRELGSMDTLLALDKLRAELIRDPWKNVIFYTHIEHEYGLARKKFDFITNSKENELEPALQPPD